ncbi:glycosyltransferase family 2 protein [Latilactobacillus sakei]|uniref:glycosyltransferase family 2 protein n=1 Tax=Latilactobacillus sakei TaxID=1599 RepID=UPI0024DF5781|nr:glycosyltransferase family 2 protein [Latilactobacillus sakei]
MDLSVVILNYLNYEDTITCVNTVLSQSYQPKLIVIVDNASTNDSFKILNERFMSYNQVHVVRTDVNLGFAQGNNVGIKYCLNKNSRNVLVLNNDVIFEGEDFLLKLSKIDEQDNIGMIGTNIIGKNGKNQNPVYMNNTFFNLLKRLNYLLFSETRPYIILKKMMHRDSVENIQRIEKEDKMVVHHDNNYILHGAAILFTNNFFKNYSGFFPETFLYIEENILDFMLKKANLKTLFIGDLTIKHKEDQSSEMAFSNKRKIYKKYMLKSTVVAIKVFFMTKKQITRKTFSNFNELKYFEE